MFPILNVSFKNNWYKIGLASLNIISLLNDHLIQPIESGVKQPGNNDKKYGNHKIKIVKKHIDYQKIRLWM